MPTNMLGHVCLPGLRSNEVVCPKCGKYVQIIVLKNEEVPTGDGAIASGHIIADIIACSHCASAISVIPHR